MKRLISAMMLVTFLVTSGMTCKNTSPKQVAYTSLATVGAAVNNAANAVAAARVQRKVSDADWQKAIDAHSKYLLAYNQTCAIAAYDFSTYAPESLIQLELDFLNTVNAILTKK